jgi:hypothetical protein
VAETKDVETKEAAKAEKALATEGTVDEAVEKARASKAGQLGELEDGAAAGTGMTRVRKNATKMELTWKPAAILPESSPKEPASLATTAGVPATLAERPKTSESTVPAVDAPASTAAPAESDAAHPKRPYEKPIFNTEENLKPHKMPKTDEEALAASVPEEKKTVDTLAGAGPASTAALTIPEPVPVQDEASKVVETPKVEERVAEEKVEAPKEVAETPKVAEEKIPAESAPKPTAAQSGAGKPTSSPEAVAAANAAILSSKGDKAAAPAAAPVVAKEAEPKKPEAALKRGEEPLPKTEAPKPETKAEPVKEEAGKAQQETQKTSEVAEQGEKKKGGFLSWLKRKFK